MDVSVNMQRKFHQSMPIDVEVPQIHAQCTLCRRCGFHSAVLGKAVDTPVVFQRQVPGLVQPVLKTVEGPQLQYFQGPCFGISSTRCGRPRDLVATSSRSFRRTVGRASDSVM